MHQIQTDQRKSLVLVVYTGSIDIAERERTLVEVAPLLKAGLRNVLVDFCLAKCSIDDFPRSNAFASRIAGDAMLRSCSIAYVSDDISKLNPVIEALSAARGLVFEHFQTRGQALEWLDDRLAQSDLLDFPKAKPASDAPLRADADRSFLRRREDQTLSSRAGVAHRTGNPDPTGVVSSSEDRETGDKTIDSIRAAG